MLSGDGEIGDGHGQTMDLLLGEPLDLEDFLAGQKLEMKQRHVEQDLVRGGQGGEAGPDHLLMGCQGFEPGLGERADEVDHRNVHRAGDYGHGTAAEIERLQ